MDKHNFSKYDRDQMEKARRIILKLYERYYGCNKMRSKVKRLETILSKLEYLIQE